MDYSQMVIIKRNNLKDSDAIRGVILKESQDLLLLQYITDFMLDGLMVLSQKDITGIVQDNTCIFQTQRLKDMKLYKKIPFDSDYDIRNWQAFFNSIKNDYKLYTVEEERGYSHDYDLGKIKKIKKNKIKLKTFTGVARWMKGTTSFYYTDITCVQIGNRYCKVYEDYFAQLQKTQAKKSDKS